MHREIFDDISNNELFKWNAPYFQIYLQDILLEYSYLQICKLHDAAKFIRGGRTSYNLSISYIIEELDWGDKRDSMKQLAGTLNELYQYINPARNKAIAHNDLEILLREEPVGEFPEGLDIEYFERLREFVSLVHEKWIGGPNLFMDMKFAKADACEYLEVLKNSNQARFQLSPKV